MTTERYAMTSDARKRLAESQAELLAAADPFRCTVCGNTTPAAEQVAELLAKIARVEALADEWLDAGAVESGNYPQSVGQAEDMCARNLRAALRGTR